MEIGEILAWLPASVAGVFAGILAVLNIIYAIMEKGGKTTKGFLNIVKMVKEKKAKKDAREKLINDTIAYISVLQTHTSPESIAARDTWMQSVEDRALKYDNAVSELKSVEASVRAATKLSEDVYIQNCRAQIIDFSYKVRDEANRYKISREEFDNIFDIHEEYEEFNRLHHRINGKTDRAMETIRYYHNEFNINHYFLEDTIQH